MAATIGSETATKRYAVVTGANKGIGFGICKQLASIGITVVLTARNEKRGIEAVDKLVKEFGISSDHIIFHKLDVSDSSSVLTIAEFVKAHFGRLDILVNNAGMGGATADEEALKATAGEGGPQDNWGSIVTETYELAVECLQTNYYGSKRMVEAFLPLLQLSDSPRIVSVSSFTGKLKNIPNEWAKEVLSTDPETLTEDKIDSVVNEFLKDFKEGTHKEKGWPAFVPAYIISKASLNAYTRVMAKRYPTFKINSVCPGFVKTDINYNSGVLSVDEGAESIVRLCLLPNDGPSGLYFDRNEASSYIE